MDFDNVKLQHVCRVCAREFDNMIDLFSGKRDGMILAEMLATCIGSEIYQNDLLPTNICINCMEHLCTAHEFYCVAKMNEAKFQALIVAAQSPQDMLNDKYLVPEYHLIMDGYAVIAKNDFNDIIFTEVAIGTNETLPKLESIESIHSIGSTESIDEMKSIEMVIEPYIPSAEMSEASQSPYFDEFSEPPDLPEATEWLDELNEPNQPTTKSTAKVRKIRKQFECYLCRMPLKAFREIRSHMRAHNEATPHVCQICNMRFSAKGLNEHLCHGKSVECEYCPEIFDNTIRLMEHLVCHKDQNKLYKCTACPKMYAMDCLLKVHKRQHNYMEKMFACDMCERRFKTNSLLTKHRTTHSEARRKISITICV